MQIYHQILCTFLFLLFFETEQYKKLAQLYYSSEEIQFSTNSDTEREK